MILSNPRHEAFAQALAKGKTADEAYQHAGYRPNRHNAAALARKQHISTRVRDLQHRTAEKSTWSAAERMKSLQAIHDAQVDKDPRTAIAAIQEANKMDGSHAAQKHQHAGAIGTYDLSKMSDDELDRLEAILGPLALAGGDQSGEGEAEG